MSDPGHHNRKRSAWHYVPPLPINASPYFSWPPDPKKILRWFCGGWLPLSERMIILLFAIAASVFLQPSIAPDSAPTPAVWLTIYLRNLALMCAVAGGLHWYFYMASQAG
jgi:hypothetical protein